MHYGQLGRGNVSSFPFIVKLYLQFVGYSLDFDRHPETRKQQQTLSERFSWLKHRQRRTSAESRIFFLNWRL